MINSRRLQSVREIRRAIEKASPPRPALEEGPGQRVVVPVIALALLLAVLTARSDGVEVSFSVDPSSALSLNLTVAGFELDPQGAGSLTTNYRGTIDVELDDLATPTSIDFLGSDIVAANSGNWLPAVGGGPAAGDPGTAAPANYGVFEATSLLLVGDAYGAIREITINTTTPFGALPVTDGATFPSTQTLAIATGWADINYSGGLADVGGDATRSDLAGNENTNASLADSSLERTGGLITLTLPVNADLPITFPFGAGTANISGLLTATASLGTGDFDADGDQDGRDFTIWQQGFGTTSGATRGDGDGNSDGAVLGDDRQLWEGAYAAPAGTSSAATAVPEAAALVHLALALLFLPRRSLKWRVSINSPPPEMRGLPCPVTQSTPG